MPWPMSQDYNEVIQSAAACFSDPELRQGEVVCNAMGLPVPCSGNFADVYAVATPQRKWAVKCFTRQIPGLRERYIEISKYLQRVRLPFMVEFQFLDQGIRVRGQWYPVLKMHWVEGFTLNHFVRQHLDKPPTLQALCQLWVRVAARLREAHLAHADLQHGNVLLVRGGEAGLLNLILVDYDGMCVPSLSLLKAIEVGHPNYQHPQRLKEGLYNIHVDRFSHLVIYTALRALLLGGQPLWEKYDNGDNLLFKQADLAAPTKSPLFADLLRSNDAEVKKLAGVLVDAAKKPLEQTPLLEELVQGSPPAQAIPVAWPSGQAARSQAGAREPAFARLLPHRGGTGKPGIRGGKRAVALIVAGALFGLCCLGLGILIFSVSGDKADASRLVAKGKTTPEASVHAQPKSESKPAPRIDSNPTPEPRAESPATVAPESKPEPPAKIAPEPSSQPDPKSLPEQETNLDNLRTYLTKEFPGLPVDGTQGNLDYTFKLMNRHNELAKYPTLKEIKQLLDSTQKARDALRKELPSTDSASELLWALLFRGSPVRNSLGLSPALQDGLTKYASLLEKPQPEASTAPKSPQVAEVPPKNAGPVEIQRIPGHPGPVSRVIFSNDGQRLVIGGEGVICVRELSTGEELLRMQAGKEKIFALALAADGRQLVSCGMDGSIRQWDITTGKQVRLIAMHKDWCRDLAFSKDGKTLISASGGPHGENSLKLWDFASGREVASLGAPRQPVVSLAMLPSGNRFLAGSDGGELVMWDLRTRKELLRFVGHSNNVYRLAVTSDGSLLASASADKTVRLWDVATGRELHRWSDYSDEVEWVAIAPDDRRVLTIDKGSRLRLLDITSHGEICQFQCHGTAAAFSPDGTAVATTGEDGTVQLWRLPPIVPAAQPAKEPTPHPPAAKPSVENRSFLAHTDHVLCIALSPDGRRALSGGKDGMVRLWDVETGKEVRSFGLGSGPVATVCFSGDGREIHAASTSIGDGGRQTSSKRQSWETDTGRVLSSMESIRTSTLAQPLVLALSPAGKHFLSIETVALPGGLQMCKLEFLDFANLTAGPRHLTEVRAGATCVAVAPDGSKVLTGGGSNDAALRLWDLERGSVKAIGGPTTGIVSVALSADLRYAATGGLDKSIRMWDLAKEKEVHRFTGHTGAVTSVAFSPDGSRVLSGSQDKTVRLWGVQNGKELARFEGHTDAVQSVVFSPDGKRALSGSADKSVRFWQLPN